MSAKTTFLTLISQFLFFTFANRTCVPYSHYLENGRICVCDNSGQLNETNCHLIGRRRQMCPSGQIIWQGCNQCICQENGQLACSSSICPEDTKDVSDPPKQSPDSIPAKIWCTPYRSYYLNCSICVCPPSAQLAEAKCARDKFCKLEESATLNKLVSGNNVCIPNVMYLFPCLQCLCSDGGFFSLDKCVATCHRDQQSRETCTPRSFYKKDCNVCWCPDEGIHDDKFCTHAICNKTAKLKTLRVERRNTNKCTPNTFTKPKCFYCICNADGKINEKACLELDCLKKFDNMKDDCKPGEMISVCIQCLCLRNGQTSPDYCSKFCSAESKLAILRKVLSESLLNDRLLDRNTIRSNVFNDLCQPYSVYKKDNKYCICPDNGTIDPRLCALETKTKINKVSTTSKRMDDMLDVKRCEPHSFVQIDCNTCYCSKNGTIDPRWCTYDDCESKRIIAKSQKSVMAMSNPEISNTCTPGTVMKQECNFCICPSNGSYFGRLCTKNSCDVVGNTIKDELITCDPLTYFIVDCNTCLCPEDGIKNVEKCSKSICEKSFLRSSSCEPGSLFSDDCNVCVCPLNGDKADKVCTNHTCSEADAPWKRIFKITQNLLSNQPSEGIRQLDVCFPGEEFAIGCKLCICPDIGLKAYATCTHVQCENEHSSKTYPNATEKSTARRTKDGKCGVNGKGGNGGRGGRGGNEHKEQDRSTEHCISYNVTQGLIGKCTPGSMYILRCKECICPYGNVDITLFCRPRYAYCEQAFPGFNYAPILNRRTKEDDDADKGMEVSDLSPPDLEHSHTAHKCYKPGLILDECFICICNQDLIVIEEHCFQSNAEKCVNVEPDFLGI